MSTLLTHVQYMCVHVMCVHVRACAGMFVGQYVPISILGGGKCYTTDVRMLEGGYVIGEQRMIQVAQILDSLRDACISTPVR